MERDLIAAIGTRPPVEPVPVPTSRWWLVAGLGAAAALVVATAIGWPSLVGLAP
jgi:hypothetical protein